ncbi:MAG: hypothetical protein JSR18_05930 [Proteobacteria bacterium]|nr:hypothetical protein [Pseudomonadota bacterium]
MRLKKQAVFIAVAGVLAAAGAMAQAPATAPSKAPQMMDGAAAADVTTVTAKIIAVDQATRMVTLRGPMGHEVTIHAGPEVKNLAQVKAGDNLVVRYAEALSVALDKNIEGRSKTVTSTGPVTAPAGAMPAAAGARQTRIVAAVDSVDAATQHILVEGPGGRYVEVKVKDPAVFKSIKAGDKIVLTYTEAVLLDVQRPH